MQLEFSGIKYPFHILNKKETDFHFYPHTSYFVMCCVVYVCARTQIHAHTHLYTPAIPIDPSFKISVNIFEFLSDSNAKPARNNQRHTDSNMCLHRIIGIS